MEWGGGRPILVEQTLPDLGLDQTWPGGLGWIRHGLVGWVGSGSGGPGLVGWVRSGSDLVGFAN